MNVVVLRGGPPVHPTVFSKRVMRRDQGVHDGDLVRVTTREGRPCGYALYHGSSQIALRMLTFDDRVPDATWLAETLARAEALRRDVLRLADVTNAWRISHAEADGLPGLIADRFDDVVVLQLGSLGWFRRMGELEDAVRALPGVAHVVWTADEKIAAQEGIPLDRRPPTRRAEVLEHGNRFRIDAGGGHKTGFFLDQRDGRRRVMDIARDRVVFDGMTYTGGFALAAARGGARAVTAMDLDEDAVEAARANADANGLDVDFRHGDVFDALRAFAGGAADARPDLLVLDPPKWVRDRKGLGAGVARYRDLNRLALGAVKPGGLVLTHSCSGLVDEQTFLRVLRDVALDEAASVRILHVGGAGMDHPVAAHVPEGRYLKSVLLETGGPGTGPVRSDREEGGSERPRRKRRR